MAYIMRGLDTGSDGNANSANHIVVTADMTSAVWNAVATQEVFTVTGLCRLRMWILCTATLTDAADAARIQFGHESATNAFIASTVCATAGAGLLATNCLWYDTSPLTTPEVTATAIMDYVVNGLDIGYEVTGAALTGGSLEFHCVWEPLASGASVAAGVGGPLV